MFQGQRRSNDNIQYIATMAADIAVVSFERFLNGDDKARREVAKEIYDAFSTVGWVYIKDHGVDTVEDAFSLVR